MTARASASKAGLLERCAYAFRETTPWLETRGQAAVNGDKLHQILAADVDRSIPPPAVRPTKWLETRLHHARAWLATHHRASWRAEVAYAYDPATGAGRVLGYNIGREYDKHGKLPNEIAGSADLAWLAGDTVHVRDWKTGRFVTDAVWPQLEWLGLFAARAAGASCAVVGALHATDHGVVDSTVRPLYAADLAAVAERIREQTGAIEDAWPTPGDHCDACYCPARAGCDLYQLRKKEEHDEVA